MSCKEGAHNWHLILKDSARKPAEVHFPQTLSSRISKFCTARATFSAYIIEKSARAFPSCITLFSKLKKLSFHSELGPPKDAIEAPSNEQAEECGREVD